VQRIERLAHELRPRWLAFVGKEAYRGLFGERPELGVQERTLAATRLYVLPSTSPANAAVSWDERLRWFRDLAGRASGLPKRQSIRALLVDDAGRTLLVRYGNDYGMWWVPPGGGQEPGETDEQTLRRELAEECGLDDFRIGPLVWIEEGFSLEEPGHGGWAHRVYLVRAPAFEPAPRIEMATEGAHEMRWLTAGDLEGLPTRPPDLARRLRNASGS
jgi:8-oxo-dGTP pyrophosphatase MutT (NUDIX family)